MKLIVGLGNPGKKYELTRHNIGFDVVDRYLDINNLKYDKEKFKGILLKTKICGEDVVFLKPQTYMNLSGESVIEVMNFYKIKKEDILVIYDDITLETGRIKLKQKGSAGGHNGLKNIISHLGTDNVKRIKFGIGQKPKEMKLSDYVLTKFDKSSYDNIRAGITKSCDAIDEYLKNDFSAAMNLYNKKGEKDE